MPALKLSDRPKSPPPYPVFESRIPKPEELVVLSKPLLDATIITGKNLTGCTNKWALGGDVAEVISGVNVNPDHITILTTKTGCDEISQRLAGYQVEPPHFIERELERGASIDGKSLDIFIRSYASKFMIGASRLDVHGDLQIKVGEWDWGDPLDFEPDNVNVVGVNVPIVPLKLKTEIYTGLGWMDRATKIHEAVKRSRHMFG